MKIALIGFAASGKSTVGKMLAEKLGYAFVDVDEQIVISTGKSIEDIFSAQGEAAFRKAENEVLIAQCKAGNAVVSCGGGSVLNGSFAEFCSDCKTVWLRVNADTVISRLGNTPRPLFDGLSYAEIANRIEERNGFYERYADVAVETDGLSVNDVVCRILNALS